MYISIGTAMYLILGVVAILTMVAISRITLVHHRSCRAVELFWSEALPDMGEERTSQVKMRVSVDRLRWRALVVGLAVGIIILIIGWSGTLGEAAGLFQLLGWVQLLAVGGRATMHYWRRHERWLNRW